MPEVREVFRMATQKVGPEPGALERQFHGQRRRSARRKGSALALAAALAITAAVVVVESARDAGAGDQVPADENAGTATLRVPGNGYAISADGSMVFTRVEASGAMYD